MPPARPCVPRAPRRAAAGCARASPARWYSIARSTRKRFVSGRSAAKARTRSASERSSSFFCWRSTSLRFQSAEPEVRVHLERVLERGLRGRRACPRSGVPGPRCCRSRRCACRSHPPAPSSPRRRRRSRAPSASRPLRRRSSSKPRWPAGAGAVVRRVVHGLARREPGRRAAPARRGRARAEGPGARAASSRPAWHPPRWGWPGAGAMPGPQSR